MNRKNQENVNKPQKSRFSVKDLWYEFRFKQFLAWAFNDAPNRLSLVAIARWIASLRYKSLLDCVEQIVVVIFQFTEFEKV